MFLYALAASLRVTLARSGDHVHSHCTLWQSPFCLPILWVTLTHSRASLRQSPFCLHSHCLLQKKIAENSRKWHHVLVLVVTLWKCCTSLSNVLLSLLRIFTEIAACCGSWLKLLHSNITCQESSTSVSHSQFHKNLVSDFSKLLCESKTTV